jgi:hypothetical protein
MIAAHSSADDGRARTRRPGHSNRKATDARWACAMLAVKAAVSAMVAWRAALTRLNAGRSRGAFGTGRSWAWSGATWPGRTSSGRR